MLQGKKKILKPKQSQMWSQTFSHSRLICPKKIWQIQLVIKLAINGLVLLAKDKEYRQDTDIIYFK